MITVQIIGLPTAGKTTTIADFVAKHTYIKYLDIRNYSGYDREYQLKKDIQNSTQPVIAESACGIRVSTNHIILVDTPLNIIYQRHKQQGLVLDEDYLSLLKGQMITPTRIIEQANALPSLLTTIFVG